MTISSLVQGMTDQRVRPDYSPGHWFPFWTICSVVIRNGKPVITNRPY